MEKDGSSSLWRDVVEDASSQDLFLGLLRHVLPGVRQLVSGHVELVSIEPRRIGIALPEVGSRLEENKTRSSVQSLLRFCLNIEVEATNWFRR